jgi:hypothetical protein
VGSDEWKLPGTLTYPAGKTGSPAVVLVPDSVPSDRDATQFATKVFLDLAATGKFESRTFIVDVRRPQIADGGGVRLKDREKTTEGLGLGRQNHARIHQLAARRLQPGRRERFGGDKPRFG